MERRSRDRREAGQLLARALAHHAGRAGLLVLALPRGGVPIGVEIAQALPAPLEILLVHRLCAPHHPQATMGAVAWGGGRVINEPVVRGLGITPGMIERAAEHANVELTRREHVYRGALFGPCCQGRDVILADDGIATGATMRAAVAAVRRQGASAITVAVPTAPADVCDALRREVDELVCLVNPQPFVEIALSYESFPRLRDEDVRELLSRFAQESGVPGLANEVPNG